MTNIILHVHDLLKTEFLVLCWKENFFISVWPWLVIFSICVYSGDACLNNVNYNNNNHKLYPIKISKLFHAHCSPYNLRTAEFAIPRFRTNKYGKHSLTYLGPKLWNKLPSEIRTLPSLFSFKNCIRKFDLGVMMDDDNCSNCILCNS